ncbi:cytochrome P450 [Sinosporangium siamense]|uniref:Cytochrome P450 n=1 Tax=Sinosporangium siamense TaxID=1367973 RepID=A0A919V562_9ACTN|nr:cytochrome P450 [Sinosporangium siamense]
MPSGDPAWLAVRYEDAVAVLTDPRFSRNLRYPGAPRLLKGYDLSDEPNSLINMDAPEHTRLRRLLAGTFTPRQTDGWRNAIRAVADDLLLTEVKAGEPIVDLTTFAVLYPVSVICAILGVKELDIAKVRSMSCALLSTADVSEEERRQASLDFHNYAAELVAEQRRSPGGGLLTQMIQARDDGDRLSERELVRLTVSLILAGHETTSSLLTRGLVRFLEPRSGYAALVEAPESIPGVVEELLRTETPGDALFMRVATEDVDLPSGRVRRGEAVLPVSSAANFDPEVFPDPRRVDPARSGHPHLGFGRGPHYCLGANLARVELQEAFRALVARLPNLALAEPASAVPWSQGHLFKRPERLLVHLGDAPA